MDSSTPLVVLCGDRATDALVQTAANLQKAGQRIASLCSPAIEEALGAAKVPHVVVSTPTDVQLMLSDRVEAVLALPPNPSSDGACANARISQWVSGAYSFVRTAAWNYKQISVIVDEMDLTKLQSQISHDGLLAFSLCERRALAKKAFTLFAELDTAIAANLSDDAELVHDILLVGNGGREHAIAWKLAQSASTGHIYVAPGNAGTENVAAGISSVNIDVNAHDELMAFAKSKGVSFCVVGPEAPLIYGLADKMNAIGIPTFGPSKLAAQLEASKAFSKDFMRRNNIPTAAYQNFTDYDKAKKYVDLIDHKIVVKASGIAAGKGVLIPNDKSETHEALREIMLEKAFGSAGDEVVLEEFMTGEEVSILAFCDGERVVCMPGVQDHKRIFDGDQGPNTGGMGAYGPAPCLTSELEHECTDIIERVVAAMRKEEMPYVGVLYAGFMLTSTGPKIVEFNCRFGDPETQVVLPLLHSDLYEIMRACVEHRLERSLVTWKTGAVATIVMASQGYPDSYPKGKVITGLENAQALNRVSVFHAGTQIAVDGSIVTSGGRVLAVTADGPSFQDAIDRAYQGLLHGAKKMKLAVLGSTRGSSMQPILDAIAAGDINASIDIVLCQRRVSRVLNLTLSDFCKEWENRVLNVHPSLLPDFAGGMDLAVHRAVIDANKTESGCTVHFVTEQVDAGPIAVQMKCPVLKIDTPETLKARVQTLEGAAFLHAIKLAQTGRLLKKKADNKEITYADAGVSIDAGNELVNRIKPLCKSTIRVGCDADLGGFGGIFDLEAAGYDKDTALVACTDGVGTKLRVAQLAKKHDTVGIDLVAMCVNDLIVQGAEPLFFLDYYACGKLDVDAATDVVKGIAEGCRLSNCGLIGGETAEMPSMYNNGDYDMAGFCVGAVRKNVILPLKVEAGFAVLGLASSGVHSNGFSLVRKLVEVSGFAYNDPCPFESGKTLGETLLTPTKIYVKQLMPIIKLGLINALAHITGGGLLENIPRVLTDDLAVNIDCSSWSLPPVFKWLQKVGNLSSTELSRTFNCGIGMVLLLPEANVAEVTRHIEATGEKVYRLGSTIARASSAEQVVLRGTMA
ncbi:phosphoribosylamine-glycine ligase [Plasmopara halstedii]|uniref:Trifunctional purine biosynthetic protein adenosine-3 n=1 Tax=Plasmopara halstedii TaxID=4781 RepID=A0A0N7L671_PLAHL|nr:phosphoribosylamine-glycine ligase [Plasmopara halstedii]CEG43459.1 phosphoribosylamine-glycine ligase [Plasmopara halstedii]|eukprot:XP_024579828.1 phosphoribosylamine-glycine ligase [Plasmopara halstedii]